MEYGMAAKRKKSILDDKDKVIEIVDRLGNELLTPTGHDFDEYGPIRIIDAAKKSTRKYTSKAKKKPAIALISVILAANRDYNKAVKPNIKRIEKEKPNLKTFSDLKKLRKDIGKKKFKELWGPDDDDKYKTLVAVLSAISKLPSAPRTKNKKKSKKKIKKKENEINIDYQRMHYWSQNAELVDYKSDKIGKIKNIGPATFQHLRMNFGADDVKPDLRVKEVLKKEFKLGSNSDKKVSDKKAVEFVREIARITKKKTLLIDQIFVKYGSSYYHQDAENFIVILEQIAKALKNRKVRDSIIAEATGLSLKEIGRLKRTG